MGYNEQGIVDFLQNLKKEDISATKLSPREKKLFELISALYGDAIEDEIKIIMSKMMHLQMAKYSLPKPNESAVITFDNQKTAALIFDRVWTPYVKDVPENVGFFGDTNLEIDLWSCQRVHDIVSNSTVNMELKQRVVTNARFMIDLIMTGELLKTDDETLLKKHSNESPYFTLFRLISSVLNSNYNCNVQAILPNEVNFQEEYSLGNKRLIYTVLKDVALPDEQQLSWEQVSEMRNDQDSRKKLRKLVHWFDKEMVGMKTDFIKEEIELRLENYEWALKKHGIKTIKGILGKLIDVDSLIKSSVAFGALSVAKIGINPIFGAVGYMVGKTIVEVADMYINRQDIVTGPDSAVSYVYDMKKKRK